MFWQQTSDELIQNNELVSKGGGKKTTSCQARLPLLTICLRWLYQLFCPSLFRDFSLEQLVNTKGISTGCRSLCACELQSTREKKKMETLELKFSLRCGSVGYLSNIFANFRFSLTRWTRRSKMWRSSFKRYPSCYSPNRTPSHLIHVVKNEWDASVIHLLSHYFGGFQ